MVARVSGLLFDAPLKGVIGIANSSPIGFFRLYKGTLPASVQDSLLDANILSSPSVGAAAGTVSIPASTWTAPSNGVVIMASPLAIPIRPTGVPSSPVPGFIRFYNSLGSAVIDIEVSSTKENQKALISSVAAVTANQVIAVTDFRLRVVTYGPVSFNNAFASAILKQLTSQTTYTAIPAYGNAGYYAGLPYYDSYPKATGVLTPVALSITATAYDGPVPSSANLQATGTKLWEKSYSSTNGTNIWAVAGNTLELTHSFTANAIANGTPTYIRIVKPEMIIAESASQYAATYPRLEIQIPVGEASAGFASFTRTDFISGQSVTLNSFVVSLLLQEAV